MHTYLHATNMDTYHTLPADLRRMQTIDQKEMIYCIHVSR